MISRLKKSERFQLPVRTQPEPNGCETPARTEIAGRYSGSNPLLPSSMRTAEPTRQARSACASASPAPYRSTPRKAPPYKLHNLPWYFGEAFAGLFVVKDSRGYVVASHLDREVAFFLVAEAGRALSNGRAVSVD